MNQAGSPIELFWVNIFERGNPLVKQTQKALRNNSETEINSYDTHEFVAKFLKDTGVSTRFRKGPKEEKITINYDAETNTMSHVITTSFDELKDTINDAIANCKVAATSDVSSCVARAIIDDVARIQDSKTQMQKYRDVISSRLRNYTCSDDEMETTTPVSTTTVHVNDEEYSIDSLLDLPNAKIWVVNDFISDNECDILMKHGKPRLRRATVAAEDGTSVVSENRKAQQASYDIHHQRERDPLWFVNISLFSTQCWKFIGKYRWFDLYVCSA